MVQGIGFLLQAIIVCENKNLGDKNKDKGDSTWEFPRDQEKLLIEGSMYRNKAVSFSHLKQTSEVTRQKY